MALLVGLAGATVTSASLSAGVGFGSLPSLALLAYGLFVDSPGAVTDDA